VSADLGKGMESVVEVGYPMDRFCYLWW